MSNGWILALTGLITIISGYFLKLYNILFISIRLDRTLGYRCYKVLSGDKYRKIVISEDMSYDDKSDPKSVSYLILNKLPFTFTCSERILQAGWEGTEVISHVTTFRFLRNRVKKMIREITDWGTQPIAAFLYLGYYRKIQDIKRTNLSFNSTINTILENVIEDILNKKRERLGILMYGPPGNGKSSIIKYLAAELNYNIYMPLIQKETTDAGFISMIDNIPKESPAIVILEDFDNYFNNRTSVYGNESKLNFATILNVLDGLYCDLTNKIFIITANDIEKIDPAIKYRPSRCDFVIKIDNPDKPERKNILDSYGQNGHTDQLVNLTDGQSAAITSEIGKRRFKDQDFELQVKQIVESFS